ncbi:hypothetical protein PLEOSDRAFT_1096664 [Pleurotus ostreatus PC15]|uniref:Cyclin-domain-containing protein n=1 Tax=Pleurotus ostreatus (strain PC15) TaxID=1137138 RepID=A0A067NNR1_PLEO1|nr:hypothetical protein PLEOSDRAFT_1096664 [Pleurotus ostreatus PC15]
MGTEGTSGGIYTGEHAVSVRSQNSNECGHIHNPRSPSSHGYTQPEPIARYMTKHLTNWCTFHGKAAANGMYFLTLNHILYESSVLATGSSASNTTEMLSGGFIPYIISAGFRDFLIGNHPTLDVEVVVPPPPAWVNQHLAEKQSVTKDFTDHTQGYQAKSTTQESASTSPHLQQETHHDWALQRQKTQFITNTIAGRSIYPAPPEARGRRGSESNPRQSGNSRTPHAVVVATTAVKTDAGLAGPNGGHASELVGSDILGIVANLRHLAKAHGEYKPATTQPETRATREITISRTNTPAVESHRLDKACSVTGEKPSRLPSRPSQSTTAAFVDRLEDMFGPGSIMRGSGPRPSNKEPKDRSVGISRPGRSNTDTDTDSTISDTPIQRRQDKVRARDQVAESSTPRGPKPKRRRVEEVSIKAQAEGVSPANAISLESVAEWTRMLQKLIKGKSRLRQEELTAIRQLMDTIKESWMTKKLRLSLVKQPAQASSSSASTSSLHHNHHHQPERSPAPATSTAAATAAPQQQQQIPFDINTYPSTDLLKVLASLLTQIAATNDKLDSASNASESQASQSIQHATPIWHTLTTASKNAILTPSSTLTFHARNVPTISLEAYLLRILKYCPTSNQVFLSLLVYFDRMSKLSTEAIGRTFVIDSYNIHRLVIAGVTVASKFFSDVFYTNSRYAKVGGLPQAELNQLELQFLLLNDFRLVISPAEMQRYAEQLIVFAHSDNPTAVPISHSSLPPQPTPSTHTPTTPSSTHTSRVPHGAAAMGAVDAYGGRIPDDRQSYHHPQPEIKPHQPVYDTHSAPHSSQFHRVSSSSSRSVEVNGDHTKTPFSKPRYAPEDEETETETETENDVADGDDTTDDEPTIRPARSAGGSCASSSDTQSLCSVSTDEGDTGDEAGDEYGTVDGDDDEWIGRPRPPGAAGAEGELLARSMLLVGYPIHE